MQKWKIRQTKRMRERKGQADRLVGQTLGRDIRQSTEHRLLLLK